MIGLCLHQQIPPTPLFQRGVTPADQHKAGSPFVKGGQGDFLSTINPNHPVNLRIRHILDHSIPRREIHHA